MINRRILKIFSRLALGTTAVCCGTTVSAQDRTAEIDRIFSFATAETPGCAVGVSQNGTVACKYGSNATERR